MTKHDGARCACFQSDSVVNIPYWITQAGFCFYRNSLDLLKKGCIKHFTIVSVLIMVESDYWHALNLKNQPELLEVEQCTAEDRGRAKCILVSFKCYI